MTMFGVELVSRESVKPSSPTPPHLQSYTLCLIDQLHPSSHVTVILFYQAHHSKHPIEVAEKLKSSLSRTLTRFYPLAGTLKDENSTHVDCTDQGVDFLTATVAHFQLTQLLQHPDVQLLDHLLPCGTSCIGDPGRGTLLSLQLTTFACGGTAIGACMSHRIGDGTSLVAFINAWAAEARGTPSVCGPDLRAASLFWPIEQLPLISGAPVDDLVLGRFVIDGPSIKQLQTVAEKDGPRPTRVEAIVALLWRCIIKARARAGSEGPAMAVLSVDMRRRMVPPLPELSWGNLCTAEVASVVMGDEEDWERCLHRQLRSTVKKVDDEYVRRLQGPEGFLWAAETTKELFELTGTIDWYGFSSWCRFPIYKADFGWGVPIWVALSMAPGYNDIKLMDRRSDGGVEVWVTIKKKEMAELEQDQLLRPFASPHPAIAYSKA